ncbi:TonB-dependent receptor [Novosphingobium sp. JCM 18896]|nr:TonB-dependent receptor [Novosphingobium sp. JCM 18896]
MSTPALAQQGSSSDGSDIVVTARRTEERLQDVPISITVFNQAQISDRNIVTAADLGTYTPSLSTNTRFGPDKASFAIRGFSQDPATSPSVGVYFAEVVAPRSAGATTGGSGSGPGQLFDLQNVQVLKGPQGTLFGRNTTGGAVLLVPNKPTGNLEGYVQGTLGDYGQKRVEAVLNVPLADTFKVRLGVDRNKRDGYLRNRSGIGPDAVGDVDYLAARLSILADLTPDLENYTIGSFSRSDTYGILLRPIACNRSGLNQLTVQGCAQIDRQNARGDDFWDVENAHPDPRSYLRQWQVINTTTWTVSDTLTVKNIASYSEYEEQTRFDLNGLNVQPVAGRPFNYIIASHAPGYPTASQNGFTEELQLQGRSSDGRFNWQIGGYLESSRPLGRSAAFNPINLSCTDYFNLQCQNGLDPTKPNYSAGTITSTSWQLASRSIGLYAQGTYKLTEQFSVTAGVRYTWDRTTAFAENLRILFPQPNTPLLTCSNSIRYPGASLAIGKTVTDRSQCHVDYETSSQKPTWLIDVEYKPMDDLMVYGKWSRGYRQGYINPNVIAFETWNPEKVDTYELGAKASFDGAVRGYLNLAAFYNDFSDQQVQVNALARPGIPIAGANVTVNAGKSTIKGVEVEGSISPFDGFKLDVGYAYLDTKLKAIVFPAIDPNSPYGSFVQPAVGDSLPLTPKNRVTVTGTYTLPLDEAIGRIALGATFTHTDSQLATARSNPFGLLPPSDLLNLNMTWSDVLGQPIDLSAFVTNVTNEKVWLNVGNGYNSIGVESVLPGAPRMAGARLKTRFGN